MVSPTPQQPHQPGHHAQNEGGAPTLCAAPCHVPMSPCAPDQQMLPGSTPKAAHPPGPRHCRSATPPRTRHRTARAVRSHPSWRLEEAQGGSGWVGECVCALMCVAAPARLFARVRARVRACMHASRCGECALKDHRHPLSRGPWHQVSSTGWTQGRALRAGRERQGIQGQGIKGRAPRAGHGTRWEQSEQANAHHR